ncbi:hypothetical protein BACCIP111899_02615 [Bacillus rhizoplanae]|uniref:Restriction endonuclease type IV Mrr domain-containing protein n=1 Tax=Bacillus rhizoplanae TaxID=2880966 RepID=A0ABN8A2G1_9BACI|nr:restriction endonuclease [Bacillus rhizoplanae]CAG9613400.1 hypothetical protein BACCIP111899_02615 [Bacillus rhizoplanae]
MARRKTYKNKAAANVIAVFWFIIAGIFLYGLYLFAGFLDYLIDEIRNKNIFIISSLMTSSIIGLWLFFRSVIQYFERQSALIEEAEERLKLEEIRRIERERKLRTLEGLRDMDPFDFEELVADIFRKRGYKAQVTSRSNDGGKDIILRRNGQVAFVECKRYNAKKKVGRPDMQKFHSALVDANANKGYFVTSNEFASTAQEYAKGKGIQLIDGIKLLEMMEKNSKYVLSKK